MKILFATGNESKSKRFSKGLSKYDIEVISLKDINLDLNVEENGKDAIENAIIKAKAYYNTTKMITMAMDDTLYLDGVPEEEQPGMFVRRVNGRRLNDDEMIEYYSNLAKKYGKNGKILARWIYGLAIINDGNIDTYTWSKEDFFITEKRTNKLDKGYPLNSISINIKLNKYFTDITEEDKKEINQEENDVVEFIKNNVLGEIKCKKKN